MSGHPSPLMVDSPRGVRPATDKELSEYKIDDPKAFKKWNTHNRILYGRALIKSGSPTSEAWRDAFTKYPDEEVSAKKPKFLIKKK